MGWLIGCGCAFDGAVGLAFGVGWWMGGRWNWDFGVGGEDEERRKRKKKKMGNGRFNNGAGNSKMRG